MRIVSIDGHDALCEANGIRRQVSLFLLQHAPPQIGDFVLVHVGYAIQSVDPGLALAAWETSRELSAPDA